MSNNFKDHLEQDRRLVILRLLNRDTDHKLNDRLLMRGLDEYGHGVSLATVQSDLAWLQDAGAITVTVAGADVHVAELSGRGLEHVERRTVIPGINRPRPK